MKILKGITAVVAVVVAVLFIVLCCCIGYYGMDTILPIMEIAAMAAGLYFAAVIACVLIDIARKR